MEPDLYISVSYAANLLHQPCSQLVRRDTAAHSLSVLFQSAQMASDATMIAVAFKLANLHVLYIKLTAIVETLPVGAGLA